MEPRMISLHEAEEIASRRLRGMKDERLGGGVIEGVRFSEKEPLRNEDELDTTFFVLADSGQPPEVVKGVAGLRTEDLRSWAAGELGRSEREVLLWFEAA